MRVIEAFKRFYHRRPKTTIAIMFLSLSPLLLLLLLLRNGDAKGTTKSTKVSGYWQAKRATSMPPSSVNYTYLAHINYAFFAPDATGNLYANVDNGYTLLEQVVEYAHNSTTQVLLSIGGSDGSDNLTTVLADSTASSQMVSDCVALIKEYDLDGIDFDYEGPTNQDETDNAISFLTDLRKALNELSNNRTNTGHPLLSSILASTSYVDDSDSMLSDLTPVADLVDYFNVDDYDFSGSRHNSTAPNSPLFALQCDDIPKQKNQSVALAISAFTAAGIPKSKLNVGVPFYSEQSQAETVPYVGMTCYPDSVDGTDTTVAYMDAVTEQYGSGWVHQWDNSTRTGWAYQNSTGQMSSTNWGRAVTEKAKYTSCQGLRGISIWSVDMDVDGELTALAAAVKTSHSSNYCKVAGYSS